MESAIPSNGIQNQDNANLQGDDNESLASSTTVPSLGVKEKEKTGPVPELRIFHGTLVHSTWENPLEVIPGQLLGVLKGRIIFIEPEEKLGSIIEENGLADWQEECISHLGNRRFLMPGFVDADAHSLPYFSLGLDPAGGHGSTERISHHCSLARNDRATKLALRKLVQQSLNSGTTCAAYNGSSIESVTCLLADTLAKIGQRGLVGLDFRQNGNNDDTHMIQMVKVKDVYANILKQKIPLVSPYLVLSAPVPEWLEKQLADFQRQTGAWVKLTVGEKTSADLQWDLEEWVHIGDSALNYLQSNGLLHAKSLLVHCDHCSRADLKKIKASEAGVIHCPGGRILSYKPSCSCIHPRAYLKNNIPMGLGTNMATSHNFSMLECIRSCVYMSELTTKLCQVEEHLCQTVGHLTAGVEEAQPRLCTQWDHEFSDGLILQDISPITLQEAFRLATLGGAKVLGMDHMIGNFVVGKSFDAIQVNAVVPRSTFHVFERHDSMQDLIEKFLFLGDDRNIEHVYVEGNKIK